jgi:hypothetical protein
VITSQDVRTLKGVLREAIALRTFVTPEKRAAFDRQVVSARQVIRKVAAFYKGRTPHGSN